MTEGEWVSYYDDQTITGNPGHQIDIDHMVSVAATA